LEGSCSDHDHLQKAPTTIKNQLMVWQDMFDKRYTPIGSYYVIGTVKLEKTDSALWLDVSLREDDHARRSVFSNFAVPTSLTAMSITHRLDTSKNFFNK
jgi:hypothetical protein